MANFGYGRYTTTWSRYLFGASIVLGLVGIVFAARLPEWWGPVSILLMIVAATAFLFHSIVHRRQRSVAV